jgi:hypothetical protein
MLEDSGNPLVRYCLLGDSQANNSEEALAVNEWAS